jgi:beta-1,4-mannosyl-glycoprotein beta-1,4-N-acetylglucosaminyltransferase
MHILTSGEGRRWRLLFGRYWLKTLFLTSFLATVGLFYTDHLPYTSGRHRITAADLDLEDFREQRLIQSDGFLKPNDIVGHCRKHSWHALDPYAHPRKVYDLFMVNTELDWLEIRLNELYNHVDYFVILEAPTTFTGLLKPLLVQENWSKFEKFGDKIIYHILQSPPVSEMSTWNQWDHEKFQRNAMYTQVLPLLEGRQAPNEGDAILVSDLDEIPRPATLTLLRYCEFPKRLTLRSRFYYYGFQWLHRGAEWAHPQATTYAGNFTILPQDLRGGHHASRFDSEKADLWNAAWHCSSCFSTIEEMLLKMKSFSHVEYNAERFREKKRIVDYIRHGKDLWDRWDQWYMRVDGNDDVPIYLKENRAKFGYMLDRDGESAGFVDYDPNEMV